MGIIGMIRSFSPILRVVLGLGFMFILPWLWMIIFGVIAVGMMTPHYSAYDYSAYSSYSNNYQGLMGLVMVIWIIDYGGAGILFIIGIVMTISGVMDWWRAKQDS